MKHIEYLEFVEGLFRKDIKEGPNKHQYLITKLFSELGEALGEIAKYHYHSKDIRDKLKEELGDCYWYIYNLIDCLENKQEVFDFIDKTIGLTSLITEPIDIESLSNKTMSDTGAFVQDWGVNGEGLNLRHHLEKTIINLVKITHCFDLEHFHLLQGNIDKLQKRHGETYNANYYNSTSV